MTNKEVLISDMLVSKEKEIFKAIYIPFDAYYIYQQQRPANYEPIYREILRITDSHLTYPPVNIVNYYKDNGKSLYETDKIDMDYTLKEEAEAIIQVKTGFSQAGARELLKLVFNELQEELIFNQNANKLGYGELDPLDKPRLTYQKYQEMNRTTEEIQIVARIEQYWKQQTDTKFKELEESITTKLTNRNKNDVDLGRRELSDYLTAKYGLILRKHIGTFYQRDGTGYIQTSHDDLILQLKDDFKANFIHDNDLKGAIGYISKRVEPVPNVIKFTNTLYNMETMEPIETPNEPIFTLLEIPYKYNPNAESTLMKEFLDSSLARSSQEETEEAVKGIKQFTGYLFTSGNQYEVLPIITGLTGAGKSVFFNIITHIFGKDKISGISLQRLEKDSHASSQFVNSHLNIIRDSDTSMIKNNSLIKNWTGNESFSINPKYKQPFDLPAEEVPKPILVCNTMPEFKVYEDAVIRRFLIIEFLVSFTKTGKANPNLEKEILSNAEEIEWFIYQSLQAFKEMKANEEEFVFKIGEAETKELIEKHTHPLNHIVSELISKHDAEAYDTEKEMFPNDFMPVYTDDLVDAILYVSDRDGIDVPVDKHGRINKTTLVKVIRDEFDLHDGEIVKDKQTGYYSLHRDYKARLVRWNDRNAKAYPNLIPTKEYRRIVDSIQAERILKKHQNAKPIN